MISEWGDRIHNFYYTLCLTDLRQYNFIQLMEIGTVKFFDQTKGFGFIKPDNGGKDIFVHQSGLTQDVYENDRVEFEVEEGKKGPNATNVKKI